MPGREGEYTFDRLDTPSVAPKDIPSDGERRSGTESDRSKSRRDGFSDNSLYVVGPQIRVSLSHTRFPQTPGVRPW